uniref:Uncharacterized protein n=1 Tax=Acetithermum autotrophicum TaxID=1446466 RepID=H5STV8_ACEAU|nr:hypothetical protein HGMM_OP4C594 [Candidatus Acetothermum autotrophicum]
MLKTQARERTEKGALSALNGNGVAQSQETARSLYIPEWVGVNGLDRELVVEECADVEEAVKAVGKYRKQNVLLAIRYTDGSRVITLCDMRTDRIVASWTDGEPLEPIPIELICTECGREFESYRVEHVCSSCAGAGAL